MTEDDVCLFGRTVRQEADGAALFRPTLARIEGKKFMSRNIDKITSVWAKIDPSNSRYRIRDLTEKLLFDPKLINIKNRDNLIFDIRILDEVLELFRELHIIHIITLFNLKRTSKENKVNAIISSGLLVEIMAIKNLVYYGMDVPAKQVLRCFSEYIELAIGFSLDKNLLDSFFEHKDIDGPNGAREFWRKYLRTQKGKNVWNLVASEIERVAGSEVLQELREFKIQEDKILNACIHPSYFSSAMAATGVDHISKDYEDIGRISNVGVVDSASKRTCFYVLYMTSLYINIPIHTKRMRPSKSISKNNPSIYKTLQFYCKNIENRKYFLTSMLLSELKLREQLKAAG